MPPTYVSGLLASFPFFDHRDDLFVSESCLICQSFFGRTLHKAGGVLGAQVTTLVERKSRYVMLVKVANKDTESVISGFIKSAQRLPRELYKSLTWDRGKELAEHPCLTMATDVDAYFCDPQSTWQRGSNANTNRLFRQYLPRGTDLSLHSQAKLSAIARQLNKRPRKTLQYQTPAETFAECVASIS